jgi:uncharacterized protein (TIGR03067 family)
MVLVVGLRIGTPTAAEDTAPKERRGLEGTWRVTSLVYQAGPELPRWEWVDFHGEVLTGGVHLRRPDRGWYRVNPDKRPMWIDYARFLSGQKKGPVVRGIYRLRGDTLTLCFSRPGTKRPRSFTARPGSGKTLLVLKRRKS